MTQTAAAPGQVVTTQPTDPSTSPQPNSLWRRVIGVDTPSRLQSMRILLAVLCVAFGALTTAQLATQWRATDAAAGHTDQLVRVAGIKADLLHADALATNAFLVGGLEPTAQRQDYDRTLAEVSRQIAVAAEAEPGDRAVLTELNQGVLRYATTMESARANNRQGFPVGSAYLAQAGGELRGHLVPLTDALVTANTTRATASMSSGGAVEVALPGLAALIALGFANAWIAKRFHRRINVGIAAGALVVLVVTVGAVTLAAYQSSENDSVRQTSFAQVRDGATARGAANDAKTNEGLRLIARGSGTTYEKAWDAAQQRVDGAFANDGLRQALERLNGTAAWRDYVASHARIVALDEAGQWDEAVAAATTPAAKSATATWAAFDDAAKQVINDASAQTRSELSGGVSLFIVMALIAGLGALIAAAVCWQGVTLRLAEYR